jgi:prolyl oligopeptidase
MSKQSTPDTRRSSQEDDYHGTTIADPYRWLEDTDSAETQAWIAAQNRFTFEFLHQIPARERLQQRLTALWNFPRATAPFKHGPYYFSFRNRGLQNQDVLYVSEQPQVPGKVLLDPNTLSPDGTIALTNWEVSPDGSLLAYAISSSGSDWNTWKVRRVANGEDLPDEVAWSKFSGAAWLPDNSGFFYARYPAPEPGKAYEAANYHQKVYFHQLGSDQSEDRLVYARPDHSTWGFDPLISPDGRYLVLSVWEGSDTRNRLFYQDLDDSTGFVELIAELEANYQFVGNQGPIFFLQTDLQAPLSRVIAIDTYKPDRSNWRTIIPETTDRLQQTLMVKDEFVAAYLHDAHSILKRYDLQGRPIGDISLPGVGAIQSYAYELSLHGERSGHEIFYTFASFVISPTVIHCDLHTGAQTVIFQPEIDFDLSNYQTEQVFAVSRDGTRIPLFLTYRRDLVRDGSNPTLLYGYGGFDIPQPPAFTAHRLAWLDLGGIYAQAVLRGGGEYGEAWHQAGMLDKKQNVFDDFIACAEFLVDQGWTRPSRLAIEGRSNGGLLVGACLAQRPDLFGAALPAVGVMDMLRYHKFTIGWGWQSEYGSPDDPAAFKTLLAYSPLHNLKPGTAYPATMITTGDHDDRVVPGHSFKFAAALQSAQSGEAPILIRIQTKAGHGFGKPTAVLIAEQADLYAFLVAVLHIES